VLAADSALIERHDAVLEHDAEVGQHQWVDLGKISLEGSVCCFLFRMQCCECLLLLVVKVLCYG
jgi:hypothetical protein